MNCKRKKKTQGFISIIYIVKFPGILKRVRRMTVAPNTKLILTGAALLVAIVGCSVGVARYTFNESVV